MVKNLNFFGKKKSGDEAEVVQCPFNGMVWYIMITWYPNLMYLSLTPIKGTLHLLEVVKVLVSGEPIVQRKRVLKEVRTLEDF